MNKFILLLLLGITGCVRENFVWANPAPAERLIVNGVSYLKLHTSVVREDSFKSLIQHNGYCDIVTSIDGKNIETFVIYGVNYCPSLQGLR